LKTTGVPYHPASMYFMLTCLFSTFSSMSGWLIPLGIAVAAALVYRFVIAPGNA